MSKNIIENLKSETVLLIRSLGIGYDIEELVNDFHKVYYSFDVKRKRFKIVGNKHKKIFDKEKNKYIVKQKKVQIYLLKKNSLDAMGLPDLKALYRNIIEICFNIELLKMYKTIKDANSILEEKYSAINDEELQNFMEDN